jgi:hypothetical protein
MLVVGVRHEAITGLPRDAIGIDIATWPSARSGSPRNPAGLRRREETSGGAVDGVLDRLGRLTDGVARAADRAPDGVPGSADRLACALDRAADGLACALHRTVNGVAGTLHRTVNRVARTLHRTVNGVARTLHRTVDRIARSLDGVVDGLLDAVDAGTRGVAGGRCGTRWRRSARLASISARGVPARRARLPGSAAARALVDRAADALGALTRALDVSRPRGAVPCRVARAALALARSLRHTGGRRCGAVSLAFAGSGSLLNGAVLARLVAPDLRADAGRPEARHRDSGERRELAPAGTELL